MSKIAARNLTSEVIGTRLEIEIDVVEDFMSQRPTKRIVVGIVEEIAFAGRAVAIKFHGLRPVPPYVLPEVKYKPGPFADYFMIPAASTVIETYSPQMRSA